MYRGLKLCYHLLLVISIVPVQSDATSVIQVFRQLASRSLAKPQTPPQIPPSPSPSPASPAPAPADLPAKDNMSLQFPSIDANVTPVNGAYAMFVLVLIIGGGWTCFKFVKRRTLPEGVPYQELEIGHLKMVSSVNVEAAEGWDQVWDDYWDEEKGV